MPGSAPRRPAAAACRRPRRGAARPAPPGSCGPAGAAASPPGSPRRPARSAGAGAGTVNQGAERTAQEQRAEPDQRDDEPDPGRAPRGRLRQPGPEEGPRPPWMSPMNRLIRARFAVGAMRSWSRFGPRTCTPPRNGQARIVAAIAAPRRGGFAARRLTPPGLVLHRPVPSGRASALTSTGLMKMSAGATPGSRARSRLTAAQGARRCAAPRAALARIWTMTRRVAAPDPEIVGAVAGIRRAWSISAASPGPRRGARRSAGRPAAALRALTGAYRGPGGAERPPARPDSGSERALGALLLHHLLPVEPDEIDRVDVQRREAAVAHRLGHDLAGEGKSRRGHSIITAGWIWSAGMLRSRNTPA